MQLAVNIFTPSCFRDELSQFIAMATVADHLFPDIKLPDHVVQFLLAYRLVPLAKQMLFQPSPLQFLGADLVIP